MEGPNGPILRVILMGQPELKDHIAAIPQLTQRVKLFFHLEGLSFEDTQHYIYHRLTVAGIQHKDLFTESIIKTVHENSNGIPRLINKICDGLLLCAFAEDRQHVLGSDIDEIRQELLVSTDDILQTRTQKTAAAESTQVPVSDASNSALERIAAALESIDEKLSALGEKDNPKVKIFEEARRRIKEGK